MRTSTPLPAEASVVRPAAHYPPDHGRQHDDLPRARVTLADSLIDQEDQLPPCRWCRRATLYVLEERPDPIFGALGVVERTLKCAGCGQLTVI
jgi:hypothetical protein